MVTDYDEGGTAGLYQEAKNTLPVYQVDTYLLLRLVGDVSGREVLDVASGEGHFTRLLREAGAARSSITGKRKMTGRCRASRPGSPRLDRTGTTSTPP